MRRYFDYIIGTFIFLCACFYIPGQNFHDSQRLFFKTGALAIFVLSLYLKPVRNLKDIYINSFLALSLLSFVINKNSRVVAVGPMVEVVLVVMFFYVLLNHLKDTVVVYNSIIAIIVINSIIVIFQIFKIDPICMNDVGKSNECLVGLFGHPMNLGAYMSVVMPYVWSKNKWFGAMAGLLVLAPGGLDLAAKSWAGILCMGVGMSVYFWFKYRKATTIAICSLLLLCGVIGGVVYSSLPEERKEVIIKKVTLRTYTQFPLLKVALTRPYFGHSLGTFRYIIPQVKEIDRAWLGGLDVTWNNYLGCFLEIGIASIFIFLGIMRKVFREFIKSPKDLEALPLFASLSTIPLGAFFHSYMDYFNIGVACLVLYAVWNIKKGVDA